MAEKKPTKLERYMKESAIDGIEIIAQGSKKYTVFKNGKKTDYKIRKWEDWGEMIVNENMEFLRGQLAHARDTADIETWGKLFFATLKYFRAELRSMDQDARNLDKVAKPVIMLPPQEELIPPPPEIINNIEDKKENENNN